MTLILAFGTFTILFGILLLFIWDMIGGPAGKGFLTATVFVLVGGLIAIIGIDIDDSYSLKNKRKRR